MVTRIAPPSAGRSRTAKPGPVRFDCVVLRTIVCILSSCHPPLSSASFPAHN